MEYRTIGRTGVQASVIGLGLEHLDNKPYSVVESTIHAALANGINIMDAFMPGEEIRRNIGRAIRGKRSEIILQGAICSTDINQQYDISRDLKTCKRYFENLLKYLDTDYIDFGMLFFMDSEEALLEVEQNGILDYVRDLKQKGTIRGIGASSHNPFIAGKLVERGWIDLLLFSINPAFDMTPVDKNTLDAVFDDFDLPSRQGLKPERSILYNLCESYGVGITVMKTFGAGKLLSKEHTPFSEPMTPAQCIHYALSRPAVANALVGCQSPAEVEAAMTYLKATDEEKDFNWIFSEEKGSLDQACVYCSHCQPCPVSIDIATVNKYLDIAKLDENNIPPSIRQHYLALSSHASNCIACGSCEERCPFAVPIIENMSRAAVLFE